LLRQNAEELEQRLVLRKNREIDKEDFDFFVENQKCDLRVFIDVQPAQAQERAEKLTMHILEIAATKVVPILIAMISRLVGDSLWRLQKTAAHRVVTTVARRDFALSGSGS
jgi:hypothetical protein